MKNLTAIYWVKDEARYLPEYIEFHLLHGFDHFIFYDNGSTDKTYEIMEPYIKEGLVEIRTYPPGVTQRQNFWLMRHCIEEQKGKTKWLHFHAVDERTYSPTGRSVPEVLQEFEQHHIGGVCIGWVLITSSGHVARPEGLIIENFTQGLTTDIHRHVKTVINPLKTANETPHHPHNFIYLPGHYSVNERHQVVNGPFDHNGYSFEKLVNYHYVTMSEEEFNTKMNKGLLDHAGKESVRRTDAEAQWAGLHAQEHTTYNDVLQFVPLVREKIVERFKRHQHLLPFINH